MRTNQERANEIFKRAATYQTELTHTGSKWKQPWVRVLASVLVVVVLFGSGFGLFMGLRNRTHGINSFDKMYIANFANYKAIGAGGVDTTAEQVLQTQSLNPASISSNEKMYLVGVDKDNHIERCRLSDHNNQHETYEINYQIYLINSFKRYTFVEFAPFPNSSTDSNWVSYECGNSPYNHYYSYLIDNETGKFYALNVFNREKKSSASLLLGYSASLWDDNYHSYGYDGIENDDAVYVKIKMSDYSNNNDAFIYKVYVQDDNLVLEEVFDYSLNLGVEYYFVDKFDNIYLLDKSTYYTNGSSYDYTSDNYYDEETGTWIYNYKYRDRLYNALPVKYIISNGNLISAASIGLNDTRIFRSLNGICYNQERTKYINANGELVDNDFDDCGYFFSKTDKVKTVNNVDYYMSDVSHQYYSEEAKWELYKITWQDDVKFSAEKIEYTRPIELKSYAVTQDYIYIIEENEVSRIEITTGKIEPLNSDYTFTSIQTDYLGNVIFNGNDTAMNKIVGIISNDGETSILTKAREYQIYYIAPVN